MISEAIQEKLSEVLPACYSHIAPGDVIAPFIVHIEKGEPIRIKGGSAGYNYDVEVILVAISASQRETYATQIIEAIETITESTIKDTFVDEAFYVSDTPMYDEETDLYGTNILFNIISSNR